ncbi:gamma-glutamyltranspeptidase/glutathione hydrolase [Leeuwenhoekiella aestuarii]|uniref:Glutathione hydrolase proenzyme n=1 Tax=Leeuwenhoekiella aestuarii TaxID=2249426 RepID=A0A4Q0NVY8_9FLAO|nr:gamma-glutamyltransferase [Leeuwenhoekiella aestuarii]RXG15466.1 gamma-glutamyltranspeptidase/glutathione hydrolase [Leeuwenhoekiella aestuarii]RXG17427.1 gamma-glutamyltranspeptidase/glutathione hydrolase [Leeuwenhoekiella aestuarii]
MIKITNHWFLFLLLLILVSSCKTEQKAPREIQRGKLADSIMVVSAREEASRIGAEILKNGGNAFDALIAVDMALNVAYPFAGSLGGGGFMVYRKANGQIGSIDYREKAPMAATYDMYLDEEGNPIDSLSRQGPLAVGVPGSISGMFAINEKLGSMPMSEILEPVIQLAKNGYAITENQLNRFQKYAPVFDQVNGKEILYSIGFHENDTLKIEIGNFIKNPVLAETLQRIADNGKSEFYEGETAQILVDFIEAHGGIITLEDLKNYEAVWRKPITSTYKNLKVIGMPPPSSGGVCLAQIFKMLEPYDMQEYGHNTVKSIQVITEAERRAYADRSFFLGDPDFNDIPIDSLTSKAYASRRMQNFSFEKATPSAEINHGVISGYESMETTHFSIIDQYGNAVALTTTLNGAYGSKLYVDELGFFLNNEMDDFSVKPGEPNMFGLIGAAANKIEPQKRMLSSMTPTIVEKDGKLWMTVGTPGGSTIITSVLQTILNVADYNMGMQEAVDAPRFHHQWLPDVVTFEPDAFGEEILNSLQNKGYEIRQENSVILGKVDGVLVLPDGTLEGGADRRGDDMAVGF